MSKNEEKTFQDETAMKALFAKANTVEMAPSPYMKTRAMAHLNDAKKSRKTLLFWKFLSAGSFAAMLVVGLYAFNFVNTIKNESQAQQAYVIHVDFNQEDLSKVAMAEVTLPEDVYFKSSKGKAYPQKNLKLPIQIKNAGRGKLPFVVASAVEGEKNIQIRLLDENDQVIREQTIKFKFAKSNQQVSL